MRIRRAGGVLILLLLWGSISCSFQKVRLGPDRTRVATSAPLPSWPESYRLVHRLRLDVRGRRYDLIGYLAVAGERWRAVALSELGTKVFDLLAGPGAYEVLQSPRGMPTGALLDGVMPELNALFAPSKPRTDLVPVSPRETLAAPAPPAEDPSDRGPVSVTLSKGGRVVSKIVLGSFRSVEGWPSPVPDRLKVTNSAWGYTMDIELLRMDLRPVDDSAFRK